MPRAKPPAERWQSGAWIAEPTDEQVAALASKHRLGEPVARAVLDRAMTEASFPPPPSAAQTAAALADVSQLAGELGRAIAALGDDSRDALTGAALGPALRALRDIDARLDASGLTEAERSGLASAREAWEARCDEAAGTGTVLLRRLRGDIATLTTVAEYAVQGLRHRGRGNPHAIDAKIGRAVLDVLLAAGISVDRGKRSCAHAVLQDVLAMNGLPITGAESIIRRWQAKNR